MNKIDLQTARQFIVSNQFDFEQKSAYKIIQRLGYLQIDTISVIQRTHHHVLWTRYPNYKTEELAQLLKNQQIFDYWAHAASFLPIKDYRFSLIRKHQISTGGKSWYDRNPKNMNHVLDRIRAEGPLMARDFKKEKTKKTTAWAKGPMNQAIMQLFMEGKIMIVERQGFQKKFDLPERVLPNHINTDFPTEEEYFRYLIQRALKAQGLMKAREFGYLLKIDRKKFQALLKTMVQEGTLETVEIANKADEPYFMLPNALKHFSPNTRKKQLHILSPFDNLIIQRKRLKELFDFEYTLECYVPAAKRKVGYFSLPILYSTDFMGQIDLKADRKKGILMVKNLVWESQAKKTKGFMTAFSKKLDQLMQFNNCQELAWEVHNPLT